MLEFFKNLFSGDVFSFFSKLIEAIKERAKRREPYKDQKLNERVTEKISKEAWAAKVDTLPLEYSGKHERKVIKRRRETIKTHVLKLIEWGAEAKSIRVIDFNTVEFIYDYQGNETIEKF